MVGFRTIGLTCGIAATLLAGCGKSSDGSQPEADQERFEVLDEEPEDVQRPVGGGSTDSPAGQTATASNTGSSQTGSSSNSALNDSSPSESPPALQFVDFDREAQEDTVRSDSAQAFGGACDTTQDCQSGLGCASAFYTQAGSQLYVAGGYCSIACEQNEDCESLESGSICRTQYLGTGLSFCTKPCQPGVVNETKCGGRTDVICRGPRGETGSCIPSCENDQGCSNGICLAANGVCRVPSGTRAPAIGTIGSRCLDPNSFSQCNGYCKLFANSGPGLCLGSCRIGSDCGYGSGNVCRPISSGSRIGDQGECERGCESSAQCEEGSRCAPTGMRLDSGELEMSCAQTFPAESTFAQRLSATDRASVSLPDSILLVKSFSEFPVRHRLVIREGQTCLVGTMEGEGGRAVLELQLGSNNGEPFNASQFDGFSFRLSSEPTLATGIYLTTSNQPGAVFGGGFRFSPFDPDRLRVLFDDIAAPWDASQLELVRIVLAGSADTETFEVCLSEFSFTEPVELPDAG